MQVTPGKSYRAAVPFAAGAMLITAAAGLLPLAGRTPEAAGGLLMACLFALIPLVAIVAAALAGWAALRRPGGGGGDGAIAGLIVGAGVLIGAVVGLTALGWIAGNAPAFREFVRTNEPYPDSRLPTDWIAPLGAATGALAGLLSGLTTLVAATLAGLGAAVLRGPARRPAAPVAVHQAPTI